MITPRFDAVSIQLTGVRSHHILVIGGHNNATRQYLVSVECYDTLMMTWSLDSHMVEICNSSAAAVDPTNGYVYLFGGYSSAGPWGDKNGCQVYDPTTRVWTRLTSTLSPRQWAAAVFIPHWNGFIIGGGRTTYGATNSLEFYSPSTNMFTPLDLIRIWSLPCDLYDHTFHWLPTHQILLVTTSD